MAVFHIKRGNTKAIDSLVRQIDKLFPQRTADLESSLLRIHLWHDLAAEQPEAAVKHISQLLEATLKDEASKASTIANAALLGSVVGMLEPEAAQPLISQTQLSNAMSAIQGCKQSHLTLAFTRNYDKAVKYALAVNNWLQTNGALTIEEATQAAQRALAAIQTINEEHQQDAQEERVNWRELEKSLTENTKEKKLLTTKLSNVQQIWRQNPQLNNLVEPEIRNIQVPLTRRIEDGEERVEKLDG